MARTNNDTNTTETIIVNTQKRTLYNVTIRTKWQEELTIMNGETWEETRRLCDALKTRINEKPYIEVTETKPLNTTRIIRTKDIQEITIQETR